MCAGGREGCRERFLRSFSQPEAGRLSPDGSWATKQAASGLGGRPESVEVVRSSAGSLRFGWFGSAPSFRCSVFVEFIGAPIKTNDGKQKKRWRQKKEKKKKGGKRPGTNSSQGKRLGEYPFLSGFRRQSPGPSVGRRDESEWRRCPALCPPKLSPPQATGPPQAVRQPNERPSMNAAGRGLK